MWDRVRGRGGIILWNAKLLVEPCSKTFFAKKKNNRQLDLGEILKLLWQVFTICCFLKTMYVVILWIVRVLLDTSGLNLFWLIIFYLCRILLNEGSVLFWCLYFRGAWVNFSRKTTYSLIRCEVFKWFCLIFRIDFWRRSSHNFHLYFLDLIMNWQSWSFSFCQDILGIG